jgi:hypothetical protein
LATGQPGPIVLVVAVEPWLFDALAEFGTDLENDEPNLLTITTRSSGSLGRR